MSELPRIGALIFTREDLHYKLVLQHMNEPMNESMNEWMNERMNRKSMNGVRNKEKSNKWTDKKTKKTVAHHLSKQLSFHKIDTTHLMPFSRAVAGTNSETYIQDIVEEIGFTTPKPPTKPKKGKPGSCIHCLPPRKFPPSCIISLSKNYTQTAGHGYRKTNDGRILPLGISLKS